MKVKKVKTADDIERYIEGCINDFEGAISDKDETVVLLCELVAHIHSESLKEVILPSGIKMGIRKAKESIPGMKTPSFEVKRKS